ncbi:Hypothetical predicted protein, partial [Pelobates cultripes]
VSCNLLTAPVRQGGMAFPNIKSYYQAAVIAPLLTHLERDNRPQWVTLENLAIKPFLTANLIWLHKRSRPKPTSIPAQVHLALQFWDLHRKKFETAKPLSMATPIEAMTYYIPTFHASPWKERGISHLAQVYESGKLLSFECLHATHNLPHTSQYSYIQLKSFLRAAHRDCITETNHTEELSIWEQTSLTCKIPLTFKPLSGCYRLILPCQHISGFTSASQWELDLQTSFTEGRWS